MIRHFFVFTAIIFLTFFSISAQTAAARKFKHNEKIVTTYDQSRNQSMVVLRLKVKSVAAATEEVTSIYLLCGFTYEGNKPDGKVKAVQFVLELSRRIDRKDKSDIPALLAQIDDRELNLGKPKLLQSSNQELEAQVFRINLITEQIGLVLPKEAFQQITTGKRVKIKSGDVKFTFDEKHLEALRDLESRMN